jgi:ATP-dependent Lon protease
MQDGQTKLPERLPLLPLKDIVVFPQMIIPVFVAEDVCMKAVESAMANEKLIFLSAFRSESAASENSPATTPELKVSLPPPFDVYDIGTVAMVMRVRRLPDGRAKVLVQGTQKAVVRRLVQTEPFPLLEVEALPDIKDGKQGTADSLRHIRSVREQLERFVAAGRSISPDVLMLLDEVTCPGKFADLVACNLGLPIAQAQKILGTTDAVGRLALVQSFLQREIETGSVRSQRAQPTGREEQIRQHREQHLRDQLKAIRMELGDMDSSDELVELRNKVEKAGMPNEALQETSKQLKRLERMNPESAEATIARTYVEWMVDLPWTAASESKVDLQACKQVLDEDHYGLDKIKERVLEYLAVRKLNPNIKGPILCFVGPPGVGKTSLGRSVARALNRKFARISLGGLRDEAEIRGHRRTYVGAQPGRILQAMKNVGVTNPVLMLDELDKLASDYKGDPSSALLEVLDPEQNQSFSDHYVMVPYDLSQVLFIANANRLESIPAPLRDRLEIIEVSGYCDDEKSEIAKKYIIPKMMLQHGLPETLLNFSDASIGTMIHNYTRESGLRGLERTVASITRKLARTVAEGDERGKERRVVKVTPKLVRDLLGEESYLENEHNIEDIRIGVATGLAYTSAGGDILELEISLTPGKGGLALTGQLGDVMKESAQTALSFVRSRARQLGVEPEKFSSTDVHIHVPAGAIPKDGPSAGVAISLALISAFTGKPMRQDVAMTGEISLHGRILPVGGLREKVLAAIRHNLRMVFVPERNRGAISELPQSIRKRLEIRFMRSLDDIVPYCIEGVWAKDGASVGLSPGAFWSSEPAAAKEQTSYEVS